MLLPRLQQDWTDLGQPRLSGLAGECGVVVTWLQSHPLDESQEILLFLEILLL